MIRLRVRLANGDRTIGERLRDRLHRAARHRRSLPTTFPISGPGCTHELGRERVAVEIEGDIGGGQPVAQVGGGRGIPGPVRFRRVSEVGRDLQLVGDS